jgi:formylglycine-generating enzyme required for sulfatase activity
MGGKIFISHRRGDDQALAGRLYDHLTDAFGRELLLVDVDSIAPGLDFVRELEEQVAQSDVVLAVIGKGWLEARDAIGRRLDNPEDLVRIEIATALRQDKRVIPVLVGEARMPRADELPEAIRPLARRNAARLTNERFRADAQPLITALQKALKEAEALRRRQKVEPKLPQSWRSSKVVSEVARAHGAVADEAAELERQEAEEPRDWKRAERREAGSQIWRGVLAYLLGMGGRKIFVSYRRQDITARALAHGIVQYLSREFGSRNVFIDVDMGAGTKFPEMLEMRLADCKVLLALIGPGWLNAQDDEGRRRLDDPEDWVRLEISRALDRKITVIPIRVDGTELPKKAELPEDIRGLVDHQAAVVGAEGFRNEMAIARDIRAIPNRTPPRRAWLIAGGAAGVAAVVALAWVLQSHFPGAQPTVPPIDEPEAPATNVPLSPDRERRLKPKDTFKECSNCPEMIVVPAGSFMMGSPTNEPGRFSDEGPQHTVTFARPFAVGQFELTFDEWDACVADAGCNDYKPSDQGWGRDRRPVINVSWDDARGYVAWLSNKTGKTYRLLTEAEYEYAARAGARTAYPWGNDIGKGNANCRGCGSESDGKQTAPVGSFAANAFGLYDMVGNVWEWTEDCSHNNYTGAPANGYTGAPANGSAWTSGDCSVRVVRGGSWYNSSGGLRSASRDSFTPSSRGDNTGFRVGRTLPPP